MPENQLSARGTAAISQGPDGSRHRCHGAGGRVEGAIDRLQATATQGNAIAAQGFAAMHALQAQGNALNSEQLLVMQRQAAAQ